MDEINQIDKCLGQDSCEACPRFMDDCDGKEEDENNGG
jgi:hypothetical protein